MHLRPGDEVLGVLSQSDTPPLALLGCMRLLEGLLPFYRRTPACLIVCLSPSLSAASRHATRGCGELAVRRLRRAKLAAMKRAASAAARIPPHSLEAQRAVLGAILLEGSNRLASVRCGPRPRGCRRLHHPRQVWYHADRALRASGPKPSEKGDQTVGDGNASPWAPFQRSC